MELGWFEFNIHVRHAYARMSDLFDDYVQILLDFVEPFVNSQRSRFDHWHYLGEPDSCRDRPYYEIRLRFEGEEINLMQIKRDLVTRLREYTDETDIAMSEDEPLGSHEGCHGRRGERFLGLRSSRFDRDWDIIVEIMQVGSEAALKILRLGRNLVEEQSLKWGGRKHTFHPYYLHLPANQLFVEP